MSRQSLFIAAATAFVVALGGAPALAADSGGSGGSGGSSGSSGAGLECREGLVPNAANQMCVPCPDGTVYDRETKECVARSSELIDDSDLYIHGEALAVSGHYEDALDALNAVADKDAMTLTMIGYSTRKLGRTEEGIAIYHQALALDPDNLNTHEYLGEGYLAAGRVDLAEAQLDVLASLCGTDCEQYRDLRNAILGEPVWN